MTEQRPDTDERDEPGGTPSPGPDNLTSRPATPGGDDGAAKAVPGAYEADDEEQQRGKAVKPGN
jgi:hypothetical protein